jgi:hypothetical protein
MGSNLEWGVEIQLDEECGFLCCGGNSKEEEFQTQSEGESAKSVPGNWEDVWKEPSAFGNGRGLRAEEEARSVSAIGG